MGRRSRPPGHPAASWGRFTMQRTPNPRFAVRLRELLERGGTSYRALAARTFYSKSYLHDLATGRKHPTSETAARLDAALGAGGELVGLVSDGRVELGGPVGEGWHRRDSEQLADLLTTTT